MKTSVYEKVSIHKTCLYQRYDNIVESNMYPTMYEKISGFVASITCRRISHRPSKGILQYHIKPQKSYNELWYRNPHWTCSSA